MSTLHPPPNCKFLKTRSHVLLFCEFHDIQQRTSHLTVLHRCLLKKGRLEGISVLYVMLQADNLKCNVLSAEKQLSFFSPRERQTNISDSTTEKWPCLKCKPQRFLKGPSAIRNCLQELCSSEEFQMVLNGQTLLL